MKKWKYTLVLVVVTLAQGFTAAPVRSDQLAGCTAEMDVTWSPGLSSEENAGTFTSGGETGVIRCDGPVKGERQTRSGTAGVEGRYGTKDPDSCGSDGEGTGRHSFTVPTAKGSKKITNNFTFVYRTEKGVISGSFSGDQYSGGLRGSPLDGDCASQRVTRFHLIFEGDLHS
jgi:hypothetical protein